MSGYLQRLYDRAAGALPVAAPAFHPGSPLARFDQRLTIAELAQDFTFGAAPDAPALERQEMLVPPIVDARVEAPPELVDEPPQQHRREPNKSRKAKRGGREKKLPINTGPLEPQAPPRRSKRKGEVDRLTQSELTPAPPPAPSQAAAVEPLPEAPSRKAIPGQPRQLAPAVADQLASPQPGQPRLNLPVPTQLAKDSGNHWVGPPPQAEMVPPDAAQPPAQPAETRPILVPAQIPLPSTEPDGRDQLNAVDPRRTAFDWSEVDQRIERALRGLADSGPQRLDRPPVNIANEFQPDADSTPAREFMTAAEASVIGTIEHSPRHRMLFGTRWR